jgi:hypothetical protein
LFQQPVPFSFFPTQQTMWIVSPSHPIIEADDDFYTCYSYYWYDAVFMIMMTMIISSRRLPRPHTSPHVNILLHRCSLY